MPARGSLKAYLTILRDAVVAFRERDGWRRAATMAVQLIVAAIALGMLLAWLAGVTRFKAESLSAEVDWLIGENAAGVYDRLIEQAHAGWHSWLPVLVSTMLLFAMLTLLVRDIQKAMNEAVGVETSVSGRKWVGVLGKRVGGALFVGVVGVGLLASFSAKTALEVLDALEIGPVAASPWTFRVIEIVMALLLATVLFAGMFRLLPDAKMKLRWVWHAAFWAAKLYTLVQVVAAFAIVYVGGLSAYGEAAVLIVQVGFFFFAAVSFLIGTQVLRVDIERRDVHVPPSRFATDLS